MTRELEEPQAAFQWGAAGLGFARAGMLLAGRGRGAAGLPGRPAGGALGGLPWVGGWALPASRRDLAGWSTGRTPAPLPPPTPPLCSAADAGCNGCALWCLQSNRPLSSPTSLHSLAARWTRAATAPSPPPSSSSCSRSWASPSGGRGGWVGWALDGGARQTKQEGCASSCPRSWASPSGVRSRGAHQQRRRCLPALWWWHGRGAATLPHPSFHSSTHPLINHPSTHLSNTRSYDKLVQVMERYDVDQSGEGCGTRGSCGEAVGGLVGTGDGAVRHGPVI